MNQVAMAESDHHHPHPGSDASDDDDDEESGFTFAAAPCLEGAFSGGRIGVVYPVFGRPRSPPRRQRQRQEEEPGAATARVPLAQLLLEERSGRQPAGGGGELDGVPAETYCLWSPGTSPARCELDGVPAETFCLWSPGSSPARCRKSGSTGSVLRWRQWLAAGRSHSDGKEKFVFLNTRSHGGNSMADDDDHRSRHGGWSYQYQAAGRTGDEVARKPALLPHKQDLVGLFANAGALRRSYLPF